MAAPSLCPIAHAFVLSLLSAPIHSFAQGPVHQSQILPAPSSGVPLNAPPIVQIADFDQDGRTDLLAATHSHLLIYRHDADGELSRSPASQSFPFSTQLPTIRPAVAADFTGDGRSDAAVSVRKTTVEMDEIWVFPVDANGTPGLGSSAGFTLQANALSAGDFNLDGFVDLTASIGFSSGTASTRVLLNSPTAPGQLLLGAAIPSGGNEIIAADLDADGKLDLVASRPVSPFSAALVTLQGNGGGSLTPSFQTPSFTTPFSAQAAAIPIAAGDFTGDGKVDLVRGCAFGLLGNTGTIGLYAGTGTSTISLLGEATIPAPYTAAAPTLADLDGDLDLDAVIALRCNGLEHALGISLYRGGSQFSSLSLLHAPHHPGTPRVADYDGDGLVEAAAGFNTSGPDLTRVGVLIGYQENGTWRPGLTPVAGFGLESVMNVSAGDLDNDGYSDALIASHTANSFSELTQLRIGSGNGLGAFALGAPIPNSQVNAYGTDLADIDLDGSLDILLSGGSQYDGFLVVKRSGLTWAETPIPGPSTPKNARAVDINHDGWIDIVSSRADMGSSELQFLVATGPGSFSVPAAIAVASGVDTMSIGDLNHDALQDVVVGTRAGEVAVVYGTPTGLPSGLTTVHTLSPVSPGCLVATGDADGDLNLDIVALGRTIFAGVAQTLFGSGSGSFLPSSPSTLPVGGGAALPRLTEVNGDGRGEFVFSGGFGGIGLLDASGSSPALTSLSMSFGSSFVASAADFDADGKVDLHLGVSTIWATLRTLAPQAASTASFGVGSPSCYGMIGLGANSKPAIGNGDFGFVITQAPKGGIGAVLLGDAADFAGTELFGTGAQFHVDVAHSILLLGAAATIDESGLGFAPFGIPDAPALSGLTLVAQAFAVELGIPYPCQASPLGLVSSRGLQVQITQ
ncbi:MAG: VCBS repeat-containing protein [Planctomycetes bacterium]|nr:VCBS repeat-containing protein [Planctomycetota bacterium]